VLLGSDFNPGGVPGVGREAVAKMFSTWGPPRRGDLDKITGWTGEEDFEDVIEKKPVHCGSCGHPGSVGQHRKSGCPLCEGDCQTGIDCNCQYHSEDNQKLLAEAVIWRKAVATPGWPFQPVTEEFYQKPKLSVAREGVAWRRPQPGAFIKTTMGRMDWLKEYAVEKVVPVVVRWQVRHVHLSPIVTPNHIVKKRVTAGEPVLEVEWTSHDSALPHTIVACVPTIDFNEAYPDLLKEYEDMVQAKKDAKKKPKGRVKKAEKENVAPKEKKERKPRKKKEDLTKQPAIVNFLGKEKDVGEQKVELAKPKTTVFKKKAVKPKVEDKLQNESPLEDMDNILNVDRIETVSVVKETKTVVQDEKSSRVISSSEAISRVTSEFGNISICREEYQVEETVKTLVKPNDSFSDFDSDYDVDDDDSDLSDIIDEIIGKKTNTHDSLEIDELTKKVENINILVETSTPLEVKFSVGHDIEACSPSLKTDLLVKATTKPVPPQLQPKLKSAIFDLNDDDFADSFDEFDLVADENTNLMDRLKKKLGSSS